MEAATVRERPMALRATKSTEDAFPAGSVESTVWGASSTKRLPEADFPQTG